MKRILALLLTLMMALSLTACGGDNNADLVGTWKWTCDITEEFQKGVNEGAGMDVPVEAKVEMTFVLVFNEDGTFTLSVDKDALSASVQGYIDAMVPVTVDLVYQQLEDQGMSRADIDEAMKAQGITVEEYVKQLQCAGRGPADGRPGPGKPHRLFPRCQGQAVHQREGKLLQPGRLCRVHPGKRCYEVDRRQQRPDLRFR